MNEIIIREKAQVTELGHTLLDDILAEPTNAVKLLSADERIGRSRIHLLLVLIEQSLYDENEKDFLQLPWSPLDKNRIHDHIFDVKQKMLEKYTKEKTQDYINHLIEKLFPDQAALFHALNQPHSSNEA